MFEAENLFNFVPSIIMPTAFGQIVTLFSLCVQVCSFYN